MNQLLRFASCIALVALSIPAFSDEWDGILQSGDATAFAQKLQEKGPDFKVDAAFMNRICDKPELVQVVLDHIYGVAPAQASPVPAPKTVARPVVKTTPPPTSAPAATTAPAPAPANNDDQAVLRLYKKLADLENAGEDGKTQKRRIEARQILTGFIMDPGSRFTQNIPGLAPWVSHMIEQANQARSNGFPKITFNADRSVAFTASDQEKGVKAYMSLYMVKQTPDGERPFNLTQELLATSEEHPLSYDADDAAFQLAPLGKHYSTIVSFKKIFKNMDPIQLHPGQWAVRVKHTTGYNKLRSDHTVYFTVNPGENYVLDVSWRKGKSGKTLHFEPRVVN